MKPRNFSTSVGIEAWRYRWVVGRRACPNSSCTSCSSSSETQTVAKGRKPGVYVAELGGRRVCGRTRDQLVAQVCGRRAKP